MIKIPWQMKLGVLLLCCSLTVYTTKIYLIDNVPGTVEYIFNSLGFLFINVLMVTLFINELLTIRARRSRLEKLNMVISTFFSEVGSDLLAMITAADPDPAGLVKTLSLTKKEKPGVKEMLSGIKPHHFIISPEMIEFVKLTNFLTDKRNFLLRLLENPIMLEHETFTGLLQATFHLTDELSRRKNLTSLSMADQRHLAGDVSRVYRLLTAEWIRHMGYLNREYPYLYSLAVRTNPFDPDAHVSLAE